MLNFKMFKKTWKTGLNSWYCRDGIYYIIHTFYSLRVDSKALSIAEKGVLAQFMQINRIIEDNERVTIGDGIVKVNGAVEVTYDEAHLLALNEFKGNCPCVNLCLQEGIDNPSRLYKKVFPESAEEVITGEGNIYAYNSAYIDIISGADVMEEILDDDKLHRTDGLASILINPGVRNVDAGYKIILV